MFWLGMTGKALLGWAAFIVLVLVISGMWMFGVGFFQKETADFRGDVKATEQVQGRGEYRIAAYDHFYNLCASIQTKDDQISIAERSLALASDSGNQVAIRDAQVTLMALQNQRAEAINQYNADARKAGTLGQFRDSGLPYEIDSKAREELTCGV